MRAAHTPLFFTIVALIALYAASACSAVASPSDNTPQSSSSLKVATSIATGDSHTVAHQTGQNPPSTIGVSENPINTWVVGLLIVSVFILIVAFKRPHVSGKP
jgi:beta-lactamase regulating signal transducer with metallopeptidase domain